MAILWYNKRIQISKCNLGKQAAGLYWQDILQYICLSFISLQPSDAKINRLAIQSHEQWSIAYRNAYLLIDNHGDIYSKLSFYRKANYQAKKTFQLFALASRHLLNDLNIYLQKLNVQTT